MSTTKSVDQMKGTWKKKKKSHLKKTRESQVSRWCGYHLSLQHTSCKSLIWDFFCENRALFIISMIRSKLTDTCYSVNNSNFHKEDSLSWWERRKWIIYDVQESVLVYKVHAVLHFWVFQVISQLFLLTDFAKHVKTIKLKNTLLSTINLIYNLLYLKYHIY